MKRLFSIAFVILFVFSANQFPQIPTSTLVNIVKAEDERRWDAALENLLKHPNAKIRERAALAAGRIGDENALSPLSFVLHDDKSPAVRRMAAFAIGEIESGGGSEAVISYIGKEKDEELTARLLEAAGKIAAANPKHEKTVWLGRSIVEELNNQSARQNPNPSVVLLGLTAVLRARPEGGEAVAAKFLDSTNPEIRATALNTLARLRSKIANAKTQQLLKNDKDPIVRANAARLLGAAEDKEALDLLLAAATKDSDSRVRVSAIRALGSLKDASVAEKLILLPKSYDAAKIAACEMNKASRSGNPNIDCNEFKSEYLEIATTLGRLLANTNNQKAIDFLEKFREQDKHESPETEIAFARIAPVKYAKEFNSPPNADDARILKTNHRPASAIAQGLGELANNPDEKTKFEAQRSLIWLLNEYPVHINALPDVLTAYAAYKPNDLNQILLKHLNHKDPIVRANAAGLIANQPISKENIEALNKAFDYAFLNDNSDNDAQLAILDALFKLDKKEAIPSLFTATTSKDYLVRKRAASLLKDESYKDSDLVKITLQKFTDGNKNQVHAYSYGSKLGQVLNTNADYIRAVSRKNGTIKAVFTTSKGSFTINLTPEDAPLTVDNFIKLAKSNYFNGVSVHRVVPNFVMQDGDPRGDGNGGPGWSIRCEINLLDYQRGAVGMALSGKDTGGSQWFVTHSPQPHLDGGYTVFGRVNEADMKTVDAIVRGDKIISIKIVGEAIPKVVKKNK